MGNLIFSWQNMCLALVGVLMFCLHKQKEKQNMLKYHTERELERRRKICRKKGYDALEVSRHIINYSNDAGYGITSLKLQKLLYFAQRYNRLGRLIYIVKDIS